MKGIQDILLPLMVALPLGGAFLALALGRFWSRAGQFMAVLTTAVTALLAGLLMWAGAHGAVWAGDWDPLDPGALEKGRLVFSHICGIAICADGLSLLMLVLISAVSFLVAIYATSYMGRYTAQNRFYALFLLMITGMNGCVLSGDLFNFFVFLEIASISSYALVGFGTESEELEAAFKYLVLGSVASIFFLFGVALTWGAFGTLNFGHLATKLRAAGGLGESPIMLLVSALFVLGLGLKASMVPFHAWLPDAHPSAPAPISAMLSGLLIKALGVYAIARLFFQVLEAYRVSSLAWVILGLGALSMVVGALMAVGQWDLKRLLAYSSISQMGYVVLALGLAMLVTGRIEKIEGRGGLIDRAERGVKVKDLLRRIPKLQKEETELRLVFAQQQSVLSSIEAGLLDPSKAGPGGVGALLERVAKMAARLKELEPLREVSAARLAREKGAHEVVLRGRTAGGLRSLLPGLRLALALALIGAIFHMMNHAAFKSLLFLCAGAIEQATGTRNLREMGGLWQRMPVTSASCAVGALSISGVPPFNGFWSKLAIIGAAAFAGHWGLAAMTVAVSVVTLLYYVKVQKYALFGPMSARVLRGTREVAGSMCFSMVALALVCLGLGVLVLWVVPGMVGPAVDALKGGAGAWVELLGALKLVN